MKLDQIIKKHPSFLDIKRAEAKNREIIAQAQKSRASREPPQEKTALPLDTYRDLTEISYEIKNIAQELMNKDSDFFDAANLRKKMKEISRRHENILSQKLTVTSSTPGTFTRCLIIANGSNKFAVPLEALKGILPSNIKPSPWEEVTLDDLLAEGTTDHDTEGKIHLQIRSAQGEFILSVDEALESVNIYLRPMPRTLAGIPLYQGTALLPDGSIALGLSVDEIHRQANLEETTVQKPCLKKQKERFLIVEEMENRFGLPLDSIYRLEEFRHKDFEFSGLQKIVRYHGKIVPVFNLGEKLNLTSSARTRINGNNEIVTAIIRMNDTFIAFELAGIVGIEEKDKPNYQRSYITRNIPSGGKELITVIDISKILSDIPEPQPTLVKDQPEILNSPKPEILIVDDSDFSKSHIKPLVENGGYAVTTVSDGEEALQLIDNSRPDRFSLIISDLLTNKIDGTEFTGILDRKSNLKNIPRIAVTRKFQEYESDSDFSFTKYIEKFDNEELMGTIDALISS